MLAHVLASYLANFYVFIGGVFVSFSNETFTFQESDMSVQLTLNLSKAIECCPVSVLLNCVIINASSKLHLSHVAGYVCVYVRICMVRTVCIHYTGGVYACQEIRLQ